MRFNLWRKFRDSQDGPSKRKESSISGFCIFFMVLIFLFCFVFLSEFTLCFHIVYHRRKQQSFHLPPIGKGLTDSVLSLAGREVLGVGKYFKVECLTQMQEMHAFLSTEAEQMKTII